MPRPKNIAWKFVIRLEGQKWRCPYCEIEYSGSVTRVRSHFLKQPKEGISSCTSVPEHIRTLMELLHNHQVRNKEDIAWKFIERLEDNKWRCHHCTEEFSGDLTRVKGHLLEVPNEGISICTQVPEHVRTLMRSLLDEGAEEESREVHGQSSMEPQPLHMPTQADVAGVESREANRQSSTEPQSRDLPTQAEVEAEEESREANGQFSTDPLFSPGFLEYMEQLNLSQQDVIVLNSAQQSQTERQFDQSSTMPSQVQNTHVQPVLVPPQQQNAPHQSETRNVLQNPTAPSSTALMDMDSCILSSSQAPNNAPPGATEISNFNQQDIIGVNSDQQSQAERQFPQSSTMLSLVRNSHGESSTMALAEAELYLHDLPDQSQCHIQSQMQMNAQQTPAGASSFQDDQLPSVGNSNCSQDCNKHSQLQTPMDIDPSIASQHTTDSHAIGTTIVDLQVPEVATNTIGPSSSQDMNRGSPIMNVRRTPQTCRWMEQEARAVDIANLPSDGATSYSSASSLPNSFFPNSLTLNAQQNPSALLPSQNCQLLDNTSQNESQRSILPGLIASDAQLTNMATTNTPQHFNQSHRIFHGQCGRGTGLSSPQASMDIEPPIPSQPYGPPFTEPFNSPPQVPGNIINATGPSTSAVQPALVPHQHQNVPHQASNNAPPPPQIQCCGTGPIGPSSLQELDMNKGAPLTSHTNTNNFEKRGDLKRKTNRLYSREADIRDELTFGVSLCLKKPRMEVENWLADVEQLRKDFQSFEATSEDCLPSHQQVDTLTQQAEDLIKQGEFPKGLFGVRKTKVNKLIERKLVGEAFQSNITKILEYLVGSQISRLGIYGMGGVGKTTLMKHIHNRLLEKANHDNVLWITVSQDFNAQKLQNNIWEALNLLTLEEKDVGKRAAMLSAVLTKREKLIIILDDVWEDFNLEEVGIPVRADGNKLVLTTRSHEVCCQMQCEEKIKIEPLSPEEAESLFFEELGSKVALNLETKAIVNSIVKECAGLPLGIITMAASMRGVTNVFEWKDCLEKLKKSDMGQTAMENRVFKQLQFSYERLEDCKVQHCFLSCALYPEDKLIDKVELIELFIDQGLICGSDTREKEYFRGFSILSKLEKVCLLEDYGENMKMHDLIRDMALHIMSATSIIEAGKELKRIPSEEYWTDALEKVSLMGNQISEIPLNMSPNCPKLSTLLLNGSLLEDAVLPGSFFKQLLGLKVLNLSGCGITELPNSISDLVNLRALLLRGCRGLSHIPYLGKLTSLRKLDVGGCFELEEVPEGLEKLVNLRYLDLRCSWTVELPERVLRGLLKLQHLKVYFLDGQDMTKLRALETLECSFEDVNDFNKCVRVIKQSNPCCYYNLYKYDDDEEESDITQTKNPERKVEIWGWDHAIVSVEGECTGNFILIPQDVQKMTMCWCKGITNLSSIGPLEYLEELNIQGSENLGVHYGGEDEGVIDILAPALAPLLRSLRVLRIYDCPKLKHLFGHLFGHVFESNFPHLREIRIERCEEMLGIIAADTSPPPHPLPFFPSLEQISISRCHKMKRAVESEWMPHFPNLRRISVNACEKMEEIIGGPPPNLPVEEISLECLVVYNCDNMRKLFPHEWLLHLRNLQSIHITECKGMVELISGVGQRQEGSIMTPVNNTPSSFQPSSISLPKLERLYLNDIPQLKSICEVPISCDFMIMLDVDQCPELKGIPLQLRLCDIEDFLHIRVEDEEQWKTLMWDHPDAQAILQPYLRKRTHNSPNAIELYVRRKHLLRLCEI